MAIGKLLLGFVILLFIGGVSQAAPVRIGLSLGLTGKYAPLAKMQEQAYRLWETHTNDAGGLLGRKIQLVIHDDQGDAGLAQKIYERMIDEENMDLLFSPYSSDLTDAIAPIAEKYGYPLLAAGASADSIWMHGYRYVFGVYSPASMYTLGFVEMALAQDLTKLAIVTADDPFSESLAKGTDKWADRLGLQVVFRKTFKNDMVNLDPIAESVKISGAEALIVCGHFDEAVNMRQALQNIGWYPKAYYASVGPVLQTYYDRLGDKAENTFSSTQWMYYDKLPFPGGKAFHQSFLATYNVEPTYHAAAAYAVGVLLTQAVQKTGSLDRKRIRDALASMDMMTMLGRYGVDRTGVQIRHFSLIIQWINGRQEVVWPSELSTTAPLFQ